MNAGPVDWEMVGAFSQVIGTLAVVISLVYLGSQVAMGNRLAQAEAWR
jgi:hypothetical protein